MKQVNFSPQGHNVSHPRQRGEVFLGPAQCLPLVLLGRDVVAEEHAHGSMAADLHRHGLRHASSNHVPDGGAAKVVEKLARDVRLLAGGRPGLPEVGDVLTLPVKHIVRQGREFVARRELSGRPATFDQFP